MIIDPKNLEDGTLQSILEVFINRDGTDYGEDELSLQEKVGQLMPQVLSGQVLILFDPVNEEINLISREEYRRVQM